MKARAIAVGSMVLLFVLIAAWHLVLAPPQRMPALLAFALHSFVLLPGLALSIARRRSAAFWGALAALVLFSHGVMELWTTPGVRWLAALEIVLSLSIIGGASWNGMRARFARRRDV